MIDIGVNLLHPQFSADREAVLDRAWRAGVTDLIITGTDVPGSAAAADFIEARRAAAQPTQGLRLFSTAGVHPHDAKDVASGWLQALSVIAARKPVVAIGECGLDFNRDFSPRPLQEEVFRRQLALAAELKMPVFVHDREAGESVAGCLREAASFDAGVVVHCFTGTREQLHGYLDLGCWIGITGWLCDPRRGQALRELVPEIPLQRLMVETDAPFLRPHNAPRDAHGRRNEPSLLPWVIRRLAALYGASETEVVQTTSANARRVFGLND